MKCLCGCGQDVAKKGNKFIIGHNNRGKKIHTNESKRKISEFRKSNKGWKHSNKTKEKMKFSAKCGEENHNYKKGYKFEGSKNPCWRGGDFVWWRNKLKQKYKRCCLCGSYSKLEMHHKDHDIKNNRRNNLIILCRKCHEYWHYN